MRLEQDVQDFAKDLGANPPSISGLRGVFADQTRKMRLAESELEVVKTELYAYSGRSAVDEVVLLRKQLATVETERDNLKGGMQANPRGSIRDSVTEVVDLRKKVQKLQDENDQFRSSASQLKDHQKQARLSNVQNLELRRQLDAAKEGVLEKERIFQRENSTGSTQREQALMSLQRRGTGEFSRGSLSGLSGSNVGESPLSRGADAHLSVGTGQSIDVVREQDMQQLISVDAREDDGNDVGPNIEVDLTSEASDDDGDSPTRLGGTDPTLTRSTFLSEELTESSQETLPEGGGTPRGSPSLTESTMEETPQSLRRGSGFSAGRPPSMPGKSEEF